ncbi:hypothetical protein EYF80_064220 [Liparis tanakae]|uniref:Uncharacterized protein n=1 Tax=Liparis tanakae TaxID=230148 RepID=A0A4Z2EA15_9TELE|nr:hypothetical protein EYF80_064220 [Liparis tanakae]
MLRGYAAQKLPTKPEHMWRADPDRHTTTASHTRHELQAGVTARQRENPEVKPRVDLRRGEKINLRPVIISWSLSKKTHLTMNHGGRPRAEDKDANI